MDSFKIFLVCYFGPALICAILIIILLQSGSKQKKKKKVIVLYFKENDEEQYLHTEGGWLKCGEDTIDSLWKKWIIAKGAYSFVDEEGFTVFATKE